MSVAEQTYSERVPRSPHVHLAGTSFLGALYVLTGLVLIFGALPAAWDQLFPKELVNEFLSGALLILASLVALAAYFYIGYRLEKANEVRGLRAGIFVAAVLLFVIAWICFSFGNIRGVQELGDAVGIFLTAGLAVGLLFAAFRLFLLPGTYGTLVGFEEQGWFHATTFKPSQGRKIRRGTILGILILGICGIFTLINHRSLGSDRLGPNDWYWQIPFTSFKVDEISHAYFLPLLHKVHVTVPLILSVLLIWVAWRIVNWPIFADFLIATEAEINKVSWTTRKRLVQDTIVVLVTVVILTTFLFAIDILWIKVLSHPWVRVLQVDIRAEQMKQQEKTQW